MKSSKQNTKRSVSEKSFQSRVLRDLGRIEGLYVFKKEAAAIRGLPDIIGCFRGRFFAWELKREGGRVSALQTYNLDLINQAGGIGRLVSPCNYKEVFLELTGSVLP